MAIAQQAQDTRTRCLCRSVLRLSADLVWVVMATYNGYLCTNSPLKDSSLMRGVKMSERTPINGWVYARTMFGGY